MDEYNMDGRKNLSSTEVSGKTEMAAKNFEFFPKLPLEVRLMIWRLAVTPRLITFVCTQISVNDKKVLRLVPSLSAKYAIPPLLCACLESRGELLKLYPLYFEDAGVPLRFNPAIDTVYINSKTAHKFKDLRRHCSFYRSQHKLFAHTGGVRNLAIDLSEYCKAFYKRDISKLKSLRHLTLVIPDDESGLDMNTLEKGLLNPELLRLEATTAGYELWLKYWYFREFDLVKKAVIHRAKSSNPDHFEPTVDVRMLSCSEMWK